MQGFKGSGYEVHTAYHRWLMSHLLLSTGIEAQPPALTSDQSSAPPADPGQPRSSRESSTGPTCSEGGGGSCSHVCDCA